MRTHRSVPAASLCLLLSACGFVGGDEPSAELQVVAASAEEEPPEPPAPGAPPATGSDGAAAPERVIVDCDTDAGYAVATHRGTGSVERGLFVLSVYESDSEHSGGKHPMGHATVDFRLPGDHVLALHAYEPVTWTITPRDGGELTEVLLYGHHDQLVEGLGDEVKVTKAQRPPCATHAWPQVKPRCEGPGLDAAAEEATGRQLTRFDGCYHASTFQFLPGVVDRG